MNVLLLFFALPVSTIILAIVLERILECPWLVGATFFAIYLIVTFAVFNASFLVFAILYAILALVTAILARLIWDICRKKKCQCQCNCCFRQNTLESINNLATTANANITSGSTVMQETACVSNLGNTCGTSGTSNANVNVTPAPTVILTNAPVEAGRNPCCCGRRR